MTTNSCNSLLNAIRETVMQTVFVTAILGFFLHKLHDALQPRIYRRDVTGTKAKG
jgi:hypothetical protein